MADKRSLLLGGCGGATAAPAPSGGDYLLLEGDMQAGTDVLLLEGDMQSGTDKLLLEGDMQDN